MKNRIIFVILAVVALGAFAFGASGTLPFAAAEAAEATDADKDRLVGVFITTEYLDLFDHERFLQDNTDQLLSGKELGEADAGAYQGRL